MPAAGNFCWYTVPSMVYFVPVIASLRKPRALATAATSSTMCSHGSGECGATRSKA